jgi:hypothetical protein
MATCNAGAIPVCKRLDKSVEVIPVRVTDRFFAISLWCLRVARCASLTARHDDPCHERGVAAGVGVERSGHSGIYDLVEHLRAFFGGRGGNGVQFAIARAHRRAFSLSAMPGKRRRNSTAADSSPPSS